MMTKPIQRTLGFILFFGFTTTFAFCQEATDTVYYNAFDRIIGVENTAVYQGVLYRAQYETNPNKTEFFKNQDFKKGSILYDRQPYHDLNLKYNSYDDRVFIKLDENTGGVTLVLFNDMLESFEIGENRFVKIDSTMAPEIEYHGFYEISVESPFFELFTRHSKIRVKRLDKKSVSYEFVNEPSTFTLFYENKYHDLSSKKEVKKLFPQLKKEIEKFYTEIRKLRKSSPQRFMVALMNRIETLILEEKGEE